MVKTRMSHSDPGGNGAGPATNPAGSLTNYFHNHISYAGPTHQPTTTQPTGKLTRFRGGTIQWLI
jgi:hypothetical protein